MSTCRDRARRPRPRRVCGRAFERVPVTVDDELPDRRVTFDDRKGHEEREDGQTLEEDLCRAVVREADETIAEECPRKKREDHDRCERGEPIDEPARDEGRSGPRRAHRRWGP